MTHSLDGKWRLSFGPQSAGDSGSTPPDHFKTISATVPGNVELDLQAAGLLTNDLARGLNAYQLYNYEKYQWWYERTFTAPKWSANQRIELVFEGLDCLAVCWLNGQFLGRTENMLVEHRFDVTDLLLKDAENKLTIRIDSPVLAAEQRVREPVEQALPGIGDALSIRKAPHMFGWDIMPRIISAGLWRSVHLQVLEPTRFRSFYFATLNTDPKLREAEVVLAWDFITDKASVDTLQLQIKLEDDDQTLLDLTMPVMERSGQIRRRVENVNLWWPRGYGLPHLYRLQARLLDEKNRVLATQEHTVGVRTIKLENSEITTPDGDGEFVFRVNGEKIFIHGSNWTPLDAFHSRDPLHLKKAIDMAADLNCNMLRCWGGGVYEDHAFFDECDRLGIMVWQDFGMACSIYPTEDDFCRKMQFETEQVVRKLRLHPSLALWCGGNETDSVILWAFLPVDPNDDKVTRQVFPSVIRRLDPCRQYLPNSPYLSPKFMAAKGNYRELARKMLTEYHLWRDTWYKSDFYTDVAVHFIGEIGFPGCPSRQSLEKFIDPEYLWPHNDNPQWQAHSVAPHRHLSNYHIRLDIMTQQLSALFGSPPDNLDDYIFASQVTQAEAIKFFIEFLRIQKWRRTGILWWNLRDGWPNFSEAVVDYYNCKKLAYHVIKRTQADVSIITGEPHDGVHDVVAVNDTLAPCSGKARIVDLDHPDRAYEYSFAIEPNGKCLLGTIPYSDHQTMWSISWTLKDGIQGQSHYLAGKPPFDLHQVRKWYTKLKIGDLATSINEKLVPVST